MFEYNNMFSEESGSHNNQEISWTKNEENLVQLWTMRSNPDATWDDGFGLY